ncbi:MAG: hypothetical protein KatS3mg011_0534 [Acidimicrobiia bacterium]|nr:MAG: hypothetical protein KatS3mg011_0534 [Acidimicrobiia bacterium]
MTTGVEPSELPEPSERQCPILYVGSDVEPPIVLVFFGCESTPEPDRPVAAARSIPREEPLRGALRHLLGGPTEEEEGVGLSSWFSQQTSNLLLSATLEDATAVVDFSAALPEVIPNASTSAGSASLLGSLNATVFQFPEVERVIYSLDGDCEAFWGWLQSACDPVERQDWERTFAKDRVETEVLELVSTFISLRIQGRGAEALLSPEGRTAFAAAGASGSGELAGLLYERNGNPYAAGRVVTIHAIETANEPETSQWEVGIELEMVGESMFHRETLVVAPDPESGDLLIQGGRLNHPGIGGGSDP